MPMELVILHWHTQVFTPTHLMTMSLLRVERSLRARRDGELLPQLANLVQPLIHLLLDQSRYVAGSERVPIARVPLHVVFGRTSFLLRDIPPRIGDGKGIGD